MARVTAVQSRIAKRVWKAIIETCGDQARPSSAPIPEFCRWVPGVGVLEGAGANLPSMPDETDFRPCVLADISIPPQTHEETREIDTPTSRKAELLLQQAQVEAARIIEEAKQRAGQLEQEAEDRVEALLLQRVNQELQRVRDEQTAAFRRAADALTEQLHQAAKARIDELAERTAALVAGITSRVIRRKVAAEDEIIVDVVTEAIRDVADADSLRIVLNPADEAILSAHEQTLLRQLGKLDNLEIVTDAGIERGGCLIASDHGEIDARVSSQLDEIWKRVSVTEVLGKTA